MKSLRSGLPDERFVTHEEGEVATAAYRKSKSPSEKLQAVAARGHPRYTGDIDFFVEKSPENTERIAKGIHDFFGPLANVQAENFLDNKRMSQMGEPPYRINILVKILGVSIKDAYARSEILNFAGENFPFIGLEDLKNNKRSTGRHKDFGDLEALERLSD